VVGTKLNRRHRSREQQNSFALGAADRIEPISPRKLIEATGAKQPAEIANQTQHR